MTTPNEQARASLHDQIMNLPCEPGYSDIAYKMGHRDARHAAAELVIGLPNPAFMEAMRKDVERLREAIQWALDDAVDGQIRAAGTTRLRAALKKSSLECKWKIVKP